MNINVFYQLGGKRPIHHIEASPDELLSALKARLAAKHPDVDCSHIYAEDADDPIDESASVGSIAGADGAKVHVHACRHVAVGVTFGRRTIERRFGPGATVARVKRWAVAELEMSDADAGEHVLQLSGTHDRPPPGTHVGALASCPGCDVKFDLVPDQRVNGASAP